MMFSVPLNMNPVAGNIEANQELEHKQELWVE